MERAVALKKLRKLLGNNLGYRVDDTAPTPDQREAARAGLRPAIEDRNKLSEKREERMKAILAADAEYQSLCIAHKAARDRVDGLSGISGHTTRSQSALQARCSSRSRRRATPGKR